MDKRGVLGHRTVAIENLESRQMLTGAVDPVVTVMWEGQKVQAYKGEYVVQVLAKSNMAQLAAQAGFTNVTSLGGNGYYSFHTTKTVKQVAAWEKSKPIQVVTLSPNGAVTTASVNLPNDTYINDQWQYENTGQLVPDPALDPGGSAAYFPGSQVGTPGDDISADQAWSITTGSRNVVVATLDTGMDMTHPDLINNLWTKPGPIAGDPYTDDIHGYDFENSDADPTDDDSHGTHVAGIIGAQGNNGQGVSGVSQQVSIIPVKVLGPNGGSWASIIEGIQYVTTLKNGGVNIVAANASLGGVNFPVNRLFDAAIKRLGDAGVLLVVAAGNDSLDEDAGLEFPAKFSLNEPNVITVAATDNQDKIAFFSNTGATTITIAAPGVNILSTFPTTAVGTISEQGVLTQTEPLNYGYDSGTSMAAPMVTGALALMKAAKPNASAAELKAALIAGGDFDPNLAAVLPAGTSLTNGSLRLNVYRSILSLLNESTNQDRVTRGNSVAAGYGSQGSVVMGETADPSNFSTPFVTGTVTGGSLQVYTVTSKDVDALQSPSNPSQRVAAQVASSGAITVDMEFTDATAHRVSLYMASLTNSAGSASQTIQLVDPDTGETIATYGTGDLSTGEYDTFQITPPPNLAEGQVYRLRMVITSNKASVPTVLNGIFFDQGVTNQASLIGTGTVTGGDWRQGYGSQGVKLFGSTSTIPSATVSGGTLVTKVKLSAGQTTALLQKNASAAGTVLGYESTKRSMDIRVDLSNYGSTERLTVYAADLGKQGRAERIDLYDDTTGVLLSTYDLTNFTAGKYVSFNASGKVRLHVTKLAGPDAVIGGVFVDASNQAPLTFTALDVRTSGNWTQTYGADGSVVFGSSSAPVRSNFFTTALNNSDQLLLAQAQNSTATVSISGASNPTPSPVVTTDPRYPVNPGSGLTSLRINNPKVSTRGINLDVKFNDMLTHQVAVYMVDPDKKGTRTQRVELQLFDPTSGQAYTVASQLVSKFSNGKYVVFNVRQTSATAAYDVRVRITRVVGATAAVNGVFFD